MKTAFKRLYKVAQRRINPSLLMSLMLLSWNQLPAHAELILSDVCRMGACGHIRFDGKTLLRDSGREQLYEVESAYRITVIGEEPVNNFRDLSKKYVLCSRTRPAVIYWSEYGERYEAHHLNPGEHPGSVMTGSQVIYWATCHNFVGPNFFSDEMRNRARDLGYPLNLRINQSFGDSLEEVLENL